MGGINSASTAAGVRTITILPSRVRCSLSSEIKVHPRLLGDRRIHRIGPTQAVLGRQRSGLVTEGHIQRDHSHVGESSQGHRERFRPDWIIAGSTNSPCHLGQYEIGTIMGSARVRRTARSCRLVAWPASRWSNPLTHTRASTVYMASPAYRHTAAVNVSRPGVSVAVSISPSWKKVSQVSEVSGGVPPGVSGKR